MKLLKEQLKEKLSYSEIYQQAQEIADMLAEFLNDTAELPDLDEFFDKYDLKALGDSMDCLYTASRIAKSMVINEDVNKSLNEANVVLSPEEMNDPKHPIDLRAVAKRAKDKEDAENAKQAAIERAKSYQAVIEKIKNSDDQLETAFEELVPSTGNADTKAGELVRAIMKILYRDYNDGDIFYEGYGLETAGPAAAYLIENGYEDEILDIANKQLEDDDYTNALQRVADKIIADILAHPKEAFVPNTEDMYDADTEVLDEYVPRYEFEIGGSDDIERLVNDGTLTSWDLKEYVENAISYERVFKDAEVSRPWGHHDTSVTVENLTKDGYDTLEDWCRNIDRFWEDLVSEYPEEDDDLDESIKITKAEIKNIIPKELPKDESAINKILNDAKKYARQFRIADKVYEITDLDDADCSIEVSFYKEDTKWAYEGDIESDNQFNSLPQAVADFKNKASKKLKNCSFTKLEKDTDSSGLVIGGVMQAIPAIRDDENRHIENLQAVVNGTVTEKNLEDSVKDDTVMFPASKLRRVAIKYGFLDNEELAKKIAADPEWRAIIKKYKDPLWSASSAVDKIVKKYLKK